MDFSRSFDVLRRSQLLFAYVGACDEAKLSRAWGAMFNLVRVAIEKTTHPPSLAYLLACLDVMVSRCERAIDLKLKRRIQACVRGRPLAFLVVQVKEVLNGWVFFGMHLQR